MAVTRAALVSRALRLQHNRTVAAALNPRRVYLSAVATYGPHVSKLLLSEIRASYTYVVQRWASRVGVERQRLELVTLLRGSHPSRGPTTMFH